jgi:catechol 2,3-dioxygenase-like lactoylglutathione lyase family enzyme
MDARINFITVATADLDAARTFYVTGLGWTPLLDVPGEIIFFQVGPGLTLGFFDATHFDADLGSPEPRPVPLSGMTVSRNVGNPQEVIDLVTAAQAAGAVVLKQPQRADFGGFHGHFRDPNGLIWEIAYNSGWAVDESGTVSLGPVTEEVFPGDSAVGEHSGSEAQPGG